LKFELVGGDFEKLEELCREANKFMQHVWRIVRSSKILSKYKLQSFFYDLWRENFNLPSQILINCIDKVVEMYRASKKQRHMPSKPEDVPIRLVRNRSYYLKENGTVRITGAGVFRLKGSPEHLKLAVERGKGAEVIRRGGKWYLHVCIEREVAFEEPKYVVGMDFGLYRIVAVVLKGKEVIDYREFGVGRWMRLRKHYLEKRRHEQSRGKVYRREKNVLRAYLEKTVETIVKYVLRFRPCVVRLENLKGLRKRLVSKVRAKRMRYLMSVTFYREMYRRLEEKLAWEGIGVEYISPKFTSIRCSRCGKFGKRKGRGFRCEECGLEIDADLNASINIATPP